MSPATQTRLTELLAAFDFAAAEEITDALHAAGDFDAALAANAQIARAEDARAELARTNAGSCFECAAGFDTKSAEEQAWDGWQNCSDTYGGESPEIFAYQSLYEGLLY